jgi:hypothetical protein
LFLVSGAPLALLSSQESARTLCIQTYNRSTASDQEISEMQITAAAVFSRARFRIIWVHCFPASVELVQNLECKGRGDGTNISLTVIDKWRGAKRQVMGAATLGTGRATVYYQRVRAMADVSGNRVSAGKLLGYAAAHEIAHLILGSSDHSAMGILKATWSSDDFRDMGQEHFWLAGELSRVP